MFSFRDFILFLAGVEFFHTMTHLYFAIFVPFPIEIMHFVITYNLNMFSMMFHAIITLLLLWWAYRMAHPK